MGTDRKVKTYTLKELLLKAVNEQTTTTDGKSAVSLILHFEHVNLLEATETLDALAEAGNITKKGILYFKK